MNEWASSKWTSGSLADCSCKSVGVVLSINWWTVISNPLQQIGVISSTHTGGRAREPVHFAPCSFVCQLLDVLLDPCLSCGRCKLVWQSGNGSQAGLCHQPGNRLYLLLVRHININTSTHIQTDKVLFLIKIAIYRQVRYIPVNTNILSILLSQ